jgi:Flp pilus assembly pilin Flp
MQGVRPSPAGSLSRHVATCDSVPRLELGRPPERGEESYAVGPELYTGPPQMRISRKLKSCRLGFLLLNVPAVTACIRNVLEVLYRRQGIMKSFLKKVWKDESGQDLIEYALMAALVATGSAVLLPMTISHNLSHIYSRVSSCLERFGTGGG